MVTIDDVARLAGVSKMTVSRVINNSGYVKDETRRRVERVIAQLNYRPNMVAQGLATGRRMRTIAHVMIDLDDIFHPLVNKGVEEACYQRGYNTLVCDANQKWRENDYINIMLEKQIDGAIFHHLDISAEQVERMNSAGVKCVLIDNEREIDTVSNIYTDNYKGGYMAAEHLIERGHTKLGCMHGVMKRPQPVNGFIQYIDTFQFNIWKRRTRGFCDAVKKHGLKLNKNFLYQGDGTMKKGMKLARDIIKHILTLQDRPTAIYCQNDVMALGAINALLEQKLDIPETMAIIGHDGLDIGNSLYPRLTTIEQPRYRMGYLAANMLIDLIEGKGKVAKVMLEPKLVVRETT